MSAFRLLPCLALLLVAAESADDTAADEKVLKDAKVGTDGPALVEFFTKRTPDADADKKAADLVKLLGSDEFAAREKASADLTALGAAAVPHLKKAAKEGDAEVRRRAEECLAALTTGSAAAQASAAARLIRAKAPAGASGALVAYLTSAPDAEVEEEVVAALLALARKAGKVDPAVAAALKDKAPVRRAAAALVAGCVGTADERGAVKKLLADADPLVRYRAARGLLAARDGEAVGILAALVAEAPPDLAGRCEAALAQLVGETGPKELPGGDSDADRKKRREAWEGWWKENKEKFDLAKADVDPLSANPGLLATACARRFWDAFLVSDMAKLKKEVQFPFSLEGMASLDEASFTKLMADASVRAKQEAGTGVKVEKVVPGAELYKQFKQAEGVAGSAPAREIQGVFCKTTGGKREEAFLVLVRCGGGKTRVLGILNPRRMP